MRSYAQMFGFIRKLFRYPATSPSNYFSSLEDDWSHHTIGWYSVKRARLLFCAERKNKTRRNDDCMIHTIHHMDCLQTPRGISSGIASIKKAPILPISVVSLSSCVRFPRCPASCLPTRYDHPHHPVLPILSPKNYRHPKFQRRTAKPVPSQPKVSITPLR